MHRVAEFLSRRDNRTQPGVLTPGRNHPAFAGCNSDRAQNSNTPVLQHPAPPGFEDEDDEDENEAPHEGGRNGLMDGWLDQRPLLKQQFCRPFRAVRLFGLSLGLKPQAESYYPFGISPLVPSETTGFVSLMRRFAHSQFRLLASPYPP
jgi:hypothetical protein